ncbi:Uncharacterised protein [Rothia kristinae]|nr:Uncharacterised protein [Rothia kristinae]
MWKGSAASSCPAKVYRYMYGEGLVRRSVR